MQRAKIKLIRFMPAVDLSIPCTGEVAYGICVEHPKVIAGHRLMTSFVVKKYKNGNFKTENTKYTVVK